MRRIITTKNVPMLRNRGTLPIKRNPPKVNAIIVNINEKFISLIEINRKSKQKSFIKSNSSTLTF